MSYYVYDNWTINKARVHRGSCSYCNEGRGIHANPSGRSSRWHGPYDSVPKADQKARSLKREITDHCRSCVPAG
jgi:hypothetical protein